MKRIGKIIAMVMVIALMVTACMKEDAQIKVLSNGYVNMTVTIDIKKDVMDKTLKQMNMSASDLDESVKEVTIDDETYYEMKQSDKQTYKELMSSDDQEAEVYVSKDTFYLSGKAEQAVSSGMSMEEMEAMMKMYGGSGASLKDIVITYSVEFENKIVKTNGTIDSNNPNKANFTMAIDDKNTTKTVFATTNANVTAESIAAKLKAANTIGTPKIKKVKANKVKKKAKKATITVKYGKVSGAKKYKVEYSTKKNFKNSKTKTTKKTTYKITKLKKGKKYFVRVFAVKTNLAGKTVTSKASKVKSVKTKK